MELNLSEGNKIVLYSSIDELTFERFNAFNKYVMLDAELGSTVSDFDKYVLRLMKFIDKDMKEESKKELLNMRLVYNNILEMNNAKGLSFASVVKSINGELLTDFSSSALKVILIRLSEMGIQVKDIYKKVEEVKKNSRPN